MQEIAGVVSPVFAPLGFGDWRIVTALMAGFNGKALFLRSVLLDGTGSLLSIISPVSAGALLVFCLLYTPLCCGSGGTKRELAENGQSELW